MSRLIPVPCARAGAPPTLAALLAAADSIWGSSRPNPGLVACADQDTAAQREVLERIARDAPEPVHVFTQTDVTRGRAAVLGAAIAAERAIEARCEHVPWPPDTPDGAQIAVCVQARAATCGRPACMAALEARMHDDGRCELCERKTARFTPVVMPIGGVVIALELCDDCASLFKP